MKSITITYPVYKTTTIDIKKLSMKYRKWLDAVFTDDDDRTDAQWYLAEKYNFFPEIIQEATGDIVDPYDDIDIDKYEE